MTLRDVDLGAAAQVFGVPPSEAESRPELPPSFDLDQAEAAFDFPHLRARLFVEFGDDMGDLTFEKLYLPQDERAVRDARDYLEEHPEGEESGEPRRRFANGLRSWLEKNRGAAAVAAGAAEGVVRARFGWLTALFRQGRPAAEAAATRARGELASLGEDDKRKLYTCLSGFFGGVGVGVAGTAAAVGMGLEPLAAQSLKLATGFCLMFGSLIAMEGIRSLPLFSEEDFRQLETKHPRVVGLISALASEKVDNLLLFTGMVGGGLAVESTGESVLRALQMNMDWRQAASAHGQASQPETPTATHTPTPGATATEQPAATATHPSATPEPSATAHPTSTPGPEATPNPHPGEDAGAHGGGGTGTETGSGTETGTGAAGGETGEYPDQSQGSGWEWGSPDEVAAAQAAGDAARATAEAAKEALTQGPVVSELMPQMAKGTAHEVIYQWLGDIPSHRMEITNAIVRSLRAAGVDVRTLHQSAIVEMAKTLGHTFATADEASIAMGVPYNEGGLWATRTIAGANSMAARAYEVANLPPKAYLEAASQLFQWVLKPVLNPILAR